MNKQRVGSARFVFESNGDNLNRTENFVRHGLVTAFDGNGRGRALRNANLAIALYDENDVLAMTVVFGNPSESMRKLMDYEFGSEESEVVPG